MSAHFSKFPLKRKRNRGTAFGRYEMSFEGGAGKKQVFLYACGEKGGKRTYTTWIFNDRKFYT